MRSAANFTLHAILAACLAALAASSAAAGGPAILTLGTETTGGTPQAASSDKPRIAVLELQAFEWGTAADTANLGGWAKAEGLGVTWDAPDSRVNKVDSFAIKQKAVEQQGGQFPGNTKYPTVKLTRGEGSTETTGGVTVASGDISGDGTAAPRKPTIGRSTISPKKLPGTGGAGESLTVGANHTESGLPTGKRQHKPFTLPVPIDKGSVWVRVASPWADCRVGKRFPSLSISDEVKTYRMVGVTVAGCGRSGTEASRPTEEVAFYYNKISF